MDKKALKQAYELEWLKHVWLSDIAEAFKTRGDGMTFFLEKHVGETLTPELIIQAVRSGDQFAHDYMNGRSSTNMKFYLQHKKEFEEGEGST